MAVKDSKFALVPVEELGHYYCKNKHVFIPPMTHYYKSRFFNKYLKS
ncbi:MAG: hypothetical protein ACRC5R_01280 [Mycoplasmatales bacterium]